MKPQKEPKIYKTAAKQILAGGSAGKNTKYGGTERACGVHSRLGVLQYPFSTYTGRI